MNLDMFKKVFDKKTSVCELNIKQDGKKFSLLCVSKAGDIIHLKNFYSEADYKRFLIESVVLRMMADFKSVKRARRVYQNMAEFFIGKMEGETLAPDLRISKGDLFE